MADTLKALHAAIDSTPLIDNHCHNLLKPEHRNEVSLLSIASEASGDQALQASKTSLAHIRATKHLAQALGCEQSWDSVEAAINEQRQSDPEAWHKRCFQGFETLLLDDGFGTGDKIQPHSWHSAFVKSKCKRIVRIETVASGIFAKALAFKGSDSVDAIASQVLKEFEDEVLRAIDDPEVVGFKSVICYRGGLDIPAHDEKSGESAKKAISSMIELHSTGIDPFKSLEQLPFNQLLVHVLARSISDSKSEHKKPIQFHTGLGDTDIILTKASPSHMQAFIEQYPKVPIVLLHSSYPWTREAGYLATMYPNVYADIGEVFPFLNKDGQEGILRQILELTPWKKVLMSTDGHSHPEMYLMTLREIKSVVKTVIGEHLTKGLINLKQGIQLVQDVFFNNSNALYDLGLEPLTVPLQSTLTTRGRTTADDSKGSPDTALIEHLTALNCKWLRVSWHDYSSCTRTRFIPMKRVLDMLQRGETVNVGLSKALLGLIMVDLRIPNSTSTGMYDGQVDLWSAVVGPTPGHASVFCEMRNEDGSDNGLCPKTILRKSIENAKDHGLEFLMGFELEFVIVERNPDRSSGERFLTLQNDGHAYCMARPFAEIGREGTFVNSMDEILDALTAAGIDIEQFHAENALGQYEIVLPARPPMEACETLLHTRQIVEAVAARHGFKMTLHPKPFEMLCGSANHLHMSINTPDGNKQEVYEPFYAGVLRHYPALIALTYSNMTSYERMVDSAWAGGRWVTWGTQNKEAPLRKVKDSHWEMKTVDGLCNPYFVIAAIIAAGTHGVASKEKFVWGDCVLDPAQLTEEDREELGITTMFPANLREALEALKADRELAAILGKEFVQRYIDIKTTELGLLEPMEAEARRQWILERY